LQPLAKPAIGILSAGLAFLSNGLSTGSGMSLAMGRWIGNEPSRQGETNKAKQNNLENQQA
jgi:hypothetical protein